MTTKNRERTRCRSGVYHIVLRGVNRQMIFECDDDFRRFVEVMESNAEIARATLYAYCLMDNHVHILLKEGEDTISEMMQRIEVSYVKYFNKKYDRVGTLFQGRFCSSPVEDKKYFERVLRYIEMNPVKAGLTSVHGYQWLWTFRMRDNVPVPRAEEVNVGEVRSHKTAHRIYTIDDYDYSATEEAELEMEHSSENGTKLLNDLNALKVMEKLTGYAEAGIIQTLPVKQRDKAVKALLAEKLPPSQISRITGVNRTTIYRISKRT